MSENRNEANKTNEPHPALVNLLLFIESVVAELKSERDDSAWTGTTVAYNAQQAITHLIQMAWGVQGLTGATTPYFSGNYENKPVAENRPVAQAHWDKLAEQLPTPRSDFSEGLSFEDAEFIMNSTRAYMDRR